MRVWLFLLFFLCLGAFFIVSNGNFHLVRGEDFVQFGNAYYSWLSSLFSHAQSVVGYAVKSEWLPPLNSTLPASEQ